MGCSTGFRPLITNMQAAMRQPTSCLLWAFMILLCTFATFGVSSHTQQDIYVPSYVYPCAGTAGCAWDVFKANATLVIINPNSGPGTSSNSDYVALVNSIKTGNSTVKIVLGYVSTNYSNRASALVLSDIDTYYSYYSVDGIFLDEGSTACDNTTLNLYKSYDARVKGKVGLGYTVLNWGTYGGQCFLTNTHIDNYVTFEAAWRLLVSILEVRHRLFFQLQYCCCSSCLGEQLRLLQVLEHPAHGPEQRNQCDSSGGHGQEPERRASVHHQ